MEEARKYNPVDRRSLEWQLQRLHEHGVWHAAAGDDLEVLGALPIVRRQFETYTDTAFRQATNRALRASFEALGVEDQAIAEILFGMGPHADLSLRDRHALAMQRAGKSWSYYRHGEWARLCKRLADALRDNREPPRPEPVDDGWGYRIEVLDQEVIVPTRERPVWTTIEKRKIVVTRDRLERWDVPARMESKGLRGPVRLRHYGYGKFTSDQVAINDTAGTGIELAMSVEFPRSLIVGETCEFTIIRDVDVDIDLYRDNGRPFSTGYEVKILIDELRIQVQLDPELPPHLVRRLDGVRPNDFRRFEDESIGMVVAPNETGKVVANWSMPTRHSWYCLVWQ